MPEQLTNTDTHALLWPVCLLTDFLSAAFYVLYLPPFQLALLGELYWGTEQPLCPETHLLEFSRWVLQSRCVPV